MTVDEHDIRIRHPEGFELPCYRKLVHFSMSWNERQTPVVGDWLPTLDMEVFRSLQDKVVRVCEDTERAGPADTDDVLAVMQLLLRWEGIELSTTQEGVERLNNYLVRFRILCIVEASRRAGLAELQGMLSFTGLGRFVVEEDVPDPEPARYH